jgi:hypothetical protein
MDVPLFIHGVDWVNGPNDVILCNERLHVCVYLMEVPSVVYLVSCIGSATRKLRCREALT